MNLTPGRKGYFRLFWQIKEYLVVAIIITVFFLSSLVFGSFQLRSSGSKSPQHYSTLLGIINNYHYYQYSMLLHVYPVCLDL